MTGQDYPDLTILQQVLDDSEVLLELALATRNAVVRRARERLGSTFHSFPFPLQGGILFGACGGTDGNLALVVRDAPQSQILHGPIVRRLLDTAILYDASLDAPSHAERIREDLHLAPVDIVVVVPARSTSTSFADHLASWSDDERRSFGAQVDAAADRVLSVISPPHAQAPALIWEVDRNANRLIVGDTRLGRVLSVTIGTVQERVLRALHAMSFSENLTIDLHPAVARFVDETRPRAPGATTEHLSSSQVRRGSRRIDPYLSREPSRAAKALASSVRKVTNSSAHARQWRDYWIHIRDERVRFGPPN